MTKKQVYKEKLAPLIEQLHNLCNEHNIAHLMTFSLEDGMLGSFWNLEDATDPPIRFIEMAIRIAPAQEFV